MKILTEEYGRETTSTVGSYVEAACKNASRCTHGQVECLSDEHDALAEMFGRLIDLLASRGQLSAEDIINLTGQQYKVNRSELLPGDDS